VASVAEQLQVARVSVAAVGQGQDVIDCALPPLQAGAAGLAAVVGTSSSLTALGLPFVAVMAERSTVLS
jgi:hypothetical protein